VLGWARPAGANMEMCIENCALKSICKQHFGEACEMYKNGGSNFIGNMKNLINCHAVIYIQYILFFEWR